MTFFEDELPCLSQNVIDYLDDLYDTATYTDAELNGWFEKFGTHAIMSARFGSKLFLETTFDLETFANCGLDGNVQMVPGSGWCDYTKGASC